MRLPHQPIVISSINTEVTGNCIASVGDDFDKAPSFAIYCGKKKCCQKYKKSEKKRCKKCPGRRN